jgi:hypothetical protein
VGRRRRRSRRALPRRAVAQASQAPGPASTAAGLVTVKTQSLGTWAPQQNGEVTISCDAGQKVLGGGFASDGSVFDLDSHPANDTTWRLYLVNGSDSQPANNVTLFATCLR